jgi:hypothetical protein
MKKLTFIASYRLLFAILGLAAVVTQYINNVELLGDAYSPVNFFSFFTIESNLLLIAVFFIGSYMAFKKKTHATFELLRGGAMIYMLVTGIIFSLLLTGLQEELLTHIPWVNAVLHYVLPVVAVLDWIIDTPRKQISFSRGLIWLTFPLSYFAYSLVRGHYVEWYPYPFLNPTLDGGWARVASMAIFITFVFVFIVWLTTRSTGSKKPAKKASKR